MSFERTIVDALIYLYLVAFLYLFFAALCDLFVAPNNWCVMVSLCIIVILHKLVRHGTTGARSVQVVNLLHILHSLDLGIYILALLLEHWPN